MKDFNFKDNKMIIAICIIIIIIFFCVFFYTRSNLESEYNEINNYNILQNETNIDENEEDTKIFVHVTGAVKSEGIVKIKEEGRIADAVEAANGFSEDADISQINLAYKLEDGQKIYIPSINDEKVKEDEKVLEKEYVTDEAGDDIILEDEISTVKTKKAVSTDMVIVLSAKSETEGLDASQIVLSSSQVTLKEGQMTSEEITATVDPTIFASIMEKTSFSFSVSISNVTTNDKNTVISSSLSTLPVIINKAAYCNLKSGIPSNSQLISNRAGWIINVEEGVEGAPNNLIDGKTGTDVALNNKGFWFTVDLGEAKVLTGIKTNHWANAYAPREVEILQSENGTTWKS